MGMGREFLVDRSSCRDSGTPIWAILEGLMDGTLKPSPYPHSWGWILYGDERESVLYSVAPHASPVRHARRK